MTTHLLPCCDLSLSVNSWGSGEAASLLGDHGAFGDEEGAWDHRALRVVLRHKESTNSQCRGISTQTRHRRENDAMRELQRSYLNGGEELERHGSGYRVQWTAFLQIESRERVLKWLRQKPWSILSLKRGFDLNLTRKLSVDGPTWTSLFWQDPRMANVLPILKLAADNTLR